MPHPDSVIERALLDRVFPGIAAQVEQRGKIIYKTIQGMAATENVQEPLKSGALFGLASLTKALSTAPIFLHLLRKEGISTTEKLGKILPECAPHLQELKLNDILLHVAGLPPIPDLFHIFNNGDSCDRMKAIEKLINIPLDTPPGKLMTYSCTGYLLLGLAAERMGDAPLNKLFEEIILKPGNLQDLMFNPKGEDKENAVTVEFDPWRNRWLKGEVHDENAWTLGGAAGNAGLFGTLETVSELMELYRGRGFLNGKTILAEEDAHSMMIQGNADETGDPRAYGFACNFEEVFAGPGFSKSAFGHTGFTGTSVWYDPMRDLKIVVLTNRVHFGREETAEKIKTFRRSFHKLFQ